MNLPQSTMRSEPGPDENWPRINWQDPNVTDAFKKTTSNEISAIKHAALGSTNIGPGASALA